MGRGREGGRELYNVISRRDSVKTLSVVLGRRNIQTRLVAPCLDSLNSGDVFVALSKDKLFQWVGKSSNVIEKARVSAPHGNFNLG